MMVLRITNRYGVKVKGSIVPYGTNDVKQARAKARLWKGKVVDLSAVGRRIQQKGGKVLFTYRKR